MKLETLFEEELDQAEIDFVLGMILKHFEKKHEAYERAGQIVVLIASTKAIPFDPDDDSGVDYELYVSHKQTHWSVEYIWPKTKLKSDVSRITIEDDKDLIPAMERGIEQVTAELKTLEREEGWDIEWADSIG